MGRFGVSCAVVLTVVLGCAGLRAVRAEISVLPHPQAHEEATVTDAGGHSAVTYVATALLDVFYVPAKLLVGSAGVVTSGLAYVLTAGDSDTFTAVWDSAVRGNYVLTPRMIEGKEPVHFAGAE